VPTSYGNRSPGTRKFSRCEGCLFGLQEEGEIVAVPIDGEWHGDDAELVKAQQDKAKPGKKIIANLRTMFNRKTGAS